MARPKLSFTKAGDSIIFPTDYDFNIQRSGVVSGILLAYRFGLF